MRKQPKRARQRRIPPARPADTSHGPTAAAPAAAAPDTSHGPAAAPAPAFTPVAVRPRHDGWTPVRQVAFVQALGASACVEEACAAVGMSPRSAYTLRARPDAASFRQAWDAALDHGITRLADAMLGRALHGVATPIFYKGERIGERRRYDERLAMFLLRARAPDRYGKWRDAAICEREDPDGAATLYARAVGTLARDAADVAAGRAPRQRPPMRRFRITTPEREEDARREAEQQARLEAYYATLAEQTAAPAPIAPAPPRHAPPRDAPPGYGQPPYAQPHSDFADDAARGS